MLTPFDDYPIHNSPNPIAHPLNGDPNQYDRYFFNGHHASAELFFAAAMGHYPVRGVIDGALSIVVDGVQHSVFVSGRMPLDRSTAIGPLTVSVVEPMLRIRYELAENEGGISAELEFTAATPAIEEPRQQRTTRNGLSLTDHTRFTQWGSWEGWIELDGHRIEIDPSAVSGTRDRSWGTRPVGEGVPNNHEPTMPNVFWHWAPLHFADRRTHLALHETPDGSRWVEAAEVMVIPSGAGPDEVEIRECADLAYDIDWKPGTREAAAARLSFVDPVEGPTEIELETQFTFRMRGIGYLHPTFAHGTSHGALTVHRESLVLADVDPVDLHSVHVQNVVTAQMGERTGVGVLEQFCMGDHEPTGLVGFLDGWTPDR